MPVEFDRVTLTLVLSGAQHSSSDIAFLTENVQAIVSAALWACLINPGASGDYLHRARMILSDALHADLKSHGRFYPYFYRIFEDRRTFPFTQESLIEDRSAEGLSKSEHFDITNPLDVSTLIGINAWARRQLYATDPDLCGQLFDFAAVDKLEHHSPVLLELGVAIGAVVTAPVLLTYGLMRALAKAKRGDLEVAIRQVELEEKREALRQRKLQTRLYEELVAAFQEQRKRDRDLKVPDAVLANAVQIASPAISELSSSPLVGKITFGATIGGGND
jgi:hypothetical protein